jgi:hypothetical protein
LTSFVGVTGLARRMSLDQVLPQFLLRQNALRGTNHWIILAFFALCTSIYASTGGKVAVLAGVYTISFLSVMALFAIGNLLLKQERDELPRSTRATVGSVFVALVMVLVALLANVVIAPENLQVFLVYFVSAGAIVTAMFLRVTILQNLLVAVEAIVRKVGSVDIRLQSLLHAKLVSIQERSVIYFTKGDQLDVLNRAALYVLRNEQTNRLTVVHVYREEDGVPVGLADQLQLIDRLYPPLRVDFLAVLGEFGPGLIQRLSKRLHVPTNAMFIGTPSDRFAHPIERLAGVRVIL